MMTHMRMVPMQRMEILFITVCTHTHTDGSATAANEDGLNAEEILFITVCTIQMAVQQQVV
jgi:hypothetical protein